MSSNPYDDFVKAVKSGNADYFLFDEIFKPDFSETLLDKNAKLREALDAEKMVRTEKAIPVKYMNRVVKYHFGLEIYKKSLEKLRSKGLVDKTLRLPKEEVIKAYL